MRKTFRERALHYSVDREAIIEQRIAPGMTHVAFVPGIAVERPAMDYGTYCGSSTALTLHQLKQLMVVN